MMNPTSQGMTSLSLLVPTQAQQDHPRYGLILLLPNGWPLESTPLAPRPGHPRVVATVAMVMVVVAPTSPMVLGLSLVVLEAVVVVVVDTHHANRAMNGLTPMMVVVVAALLTGQGMAGQVLEEVVGDRARRLREQKNQNRGRKEIPDIVRFVVGRCEYVFGEAR